MTNVVVRWTSRAALANCAAAILAALTAHGAEREPNVWTKIAAPIEGRRWDIPLGTSGPEGPVFVLGGRTSWGDYKKPRPYDVLRCDPQTGKWHNELPTGKDWGPDVGLCQVPPWKDEHFRFEDVAGNVRPNWTIYGTFSLGQKYDYDPHTKRFYFYALGRTFSYDPADRTWADLNPPTSPESELGGILLWSSMCYDALNRRFVLFGGGNVCTERGDPGTWTYSPTENRWSPLRLDVQPPPRANSRLAYDPIAKRIVLFGGDQLMQLVADTWTFDVVANRWEERRPAVGPSPRAGHALVWLPNAQRIALLGGYEYSSTTGYCESLYKSLPMEAWLYETSANRWQLAQRWEEKDAAPRGPSNFFLSAVAQPDSQSRRRSAAPHDVLTVLAADTSAWQCTLAGVGDAEATQRRGVAPGAVARRTNSYDPAWYREDVPAADPARVAAELRELPTNRWVVRPTPKRPGMNMDWGSAVFVDDSDQIVRFSGGHSAYSGTAPQVYDVAADRYSLPFAPEMPLEFVYSNDQVHGEWSFQGNPWMTGHTYKSTGYDPRLKCLVFAPHDYTYFFEPRSGRWSRGPEENPYRADFYNVTICSTPKGAVAWGDRRQGGGAGLWRLDGDSRLWKPLELRGELPQKSPDQHGLAYDAKRDRLLFFSGVGMHRGDVAEYAFATGQARRLDAVGKSQAGVPSRETVYLPEADAVLAGARVTRNDRLMWLLYDCSSNQWRGLELLGDDPIGKGTGSRAFNNSMGLMYDAKRKLVWAVGQYSHVHVLRIDATQAEPLSASP